MNNIKKILNKKRWMLLGLPINKPFFLEDNQVFKALSQLCIDYADAILTLDKRLKDHESKFSPQQISSQSMVPRARDRSYHYFRAKDEFTPVWDHFMDIRNDERFKAGRNGSKKGALEPLSFKRGELFKVKLMEGETLPVKKSENPIWIKAIKIVDPEGEKEIKGVISSSFLKAGFSPYENKM